MSTPTPTDPAARLERLEQEAAELRKQLKRTTGEVHLLQWLFVIAVAVAVGVPYYFLQSGKVHPEILFDKAVSKTINSQEFGLYNRDGKRVMFMDYDKFGEPNALFFDTTLNCKMAIKIVPAGGGTGEIALYDRTGTRALFHMDDNGRARLDLVGQKQKGGVSLTTDEDGNPRLRMTDKTGKVLLELPAPSGAASAETKAQSDAAPKGPSRHP
jgi:hypothetical protein